MIGYPAAARRTAVRKTHPQTAQERFVPALGLCLLLTGMLLLSVSRPAVAQEAPQDVPQQEQSPPREAEPVSPESPERPEIEFVPTERDSLMFEIERYTSRVEALKDSLGFGGVDVHLDEAHRQRLQQTLNEFTTVIEDIGQELSRLDFEINENRVSLTDEFGEGIIIQIPENFDKQFGQGVEALSRMILKDLPDSAGFEITRALDLSALFPSKEKSKPKRKVIQGNVVKISDNVHITDREDLRGSLVVVMGDAMVSGRVDGDVVVVMGSLLLDETAEVTGQAVCILGRLDRDPEAEVGDLVVIDPWPSHGGWLEEIAPWRGGGAAFLVSQSLFVLVLVVALLVVALTPRDRIERVLSEVRGEPLRSLGVGVLAGIAIHLVVVVLLAVLILTVVGAPLALLLAVGMGLAAALAVAVAGAAIGQNLCRLTSRECPSFVLSVAVGLIVLHLVSLLGGLVGWIAGAESAANLLMLAGLVIKALAFFVGIGAIVRSQAWRRTPA